MTRAELDATFFRRSELKSQLEAVTQRRGELAEQMRLVPDAAAARELQSRLKNMDDRAGRLETQIALADDAIADAIARGVATPRGQEASTTEPARRPGANDPSLERAMILEALAFVLLGVVLWRYTWKRAEKKLARPAAVDQSHRFDQLQQAVDVIALEVERISESQRYVAKMFSEQLPAIGAGAAQEIPAKRRTAEPIRASDDVTG